MPRLRIADPPAASRPRLELFRAEAVDRHVQAAQQGDAVLRASPAWLDWAYYVLLAGAAMAALVAILAPFSEYAEGPAVVHAVAGRDVTSSLSGVVRDIAVQPGSRVRAGALLVRLDGGDDRHEVSRLQREWELELLKVLRSPGDGTSRSNLASLRAQKERSEIRLSERAVTAPTDGLVTEVWTMPGQRITPGDRLVSLVSSDTALSLVAAVPAEALTQISAGMPLRFTLDGFSRDHQELAVTSCSAEAVGASEFRRFLGPERSDTVEVKGAIALVRAALPPSFHGGGGERSYAPGLRGWARVRVRSETLLQRFAPGVCSLWRDLCQ